MPLTKGAASLKYNLAPFKILFPRSVQDVFHFEVEISVVVPSIYLKDIYSENDKG